MKLQVPKSSECYWCGKEHCMRIVTGAIAYCSEDCHKKGKKLIEDGKETYMKRLMESDV